ncbi:hypothetical protein E3N88_38378 [Mikania micrantha]|uniref:DUF7751 domain-containing protein n=1 Tax=Mikania micrantha TaxID=192012 RepID=A0A5N6LTT3_9ASTR|nr:hypothetical protein E3N88_38378 [Mikania micrantha]
MGSAVSTMLLSHTATRGDREATGEGNDYEASANAIERQPAVVRRKTRLRASTVDERPKAPNGTSYLEMDERWVLTAYKMADHRTGLECEVLETLCIKDQLLTNEGAEKVVGWALSHHLMQHAQKRLLADVIPPSDIGVTFDDIGALEKVKDTLKATKKIHKTETLRYERQDSEIQRLNKIIDELVKEKESEKAEKEKEKAEKEAMLERMASIESLLRVVTKNLPSSS